ncbi:hypothetical protein COT07_02105 [Candidatus Woesearchaeota archaeon CG07_land_8_20_14_0_80_44_23]|jgi:hypothetical protein|nr:MAG: hypothetical protein COT07_02105 [Candidatus Woesearchaeota archaeon CG07_land_8_20_14_0_80_44_23]
MALDSETEKKILEFVYKKPCTISEIASLIQRNWRTADAYLEMISQRSGAIAVRTFRKGTRGALKIVYWNNNEKMNSSEAQERLFGQIRAGRTKKDFSPFNIYQFVDSRKRTAFVEQQGEEATTVKQDLAGILRSAKNQILIFSGNLSWSNLKQGRENIIDVFENIAKRGVSIKILSKVDITSYKNVVKMLEINHRLGKDVIEIRQCEQPLRAFIIDDEVARFKEILNPEDYAREEIDRKTYAFYEIKDKEWIEWLTKVFWNLFRTSIPAQKSIQDLKSIRGIEIKV